MSATSTTAAAPIHHFNNPHSRNSNSNSNYQSFTNPNPHLNNLNSISTINDLSHLNPSWSATTTRVPIPLPSHAFSAEADAPLNLGLDEEEVVWTGDSVGQGFGLLSDKSSSKGFGSLQGLFGNMKGGIGLDAIDWTCRLCSKTATDPCVTRCGHLFCWSHLSEHLSKVSNKCPTCSRPLSMDRDAVQVFGRPKVVLSGTAWSTKSTSAIDTPGSVGSVHSVQTHTQTSGQSLFPSSVPAAGAGSISGRRGSYPQLSQFEDEKSSFQRVSDRDDQGGNDQRHIEEEVNIPPPPGSPLGPRSRSGSSLLPPSQDSIPSRQSQTHPREAILRSWSNLSSSSGSSSYEPRPKPESRGSYIEEEEALGLRPLPQTTKAYSNATSVLRRDSEATIMPRSDRGSPISTPHFSSSFSSNGNTGNGGNAGDDSLRPPSPRLRTKAFNPGWALKSPLGFSYESGDSSAGEDSDYPLTATKHTAGRTAIRLDSPPRGRPPSFSATSPVTAVSPRQAFDPEFDYRSAGQKYFDGPADEEQDAGGYGGQNRQRSTSTVKGEGNRTGRFRSNTIRATQSPPPPHSPPSPYSPRSPTQQYAQGNSFPWDTKSRDIYPDEKQVDYDDPNGLTDEQQQQQQEQEQKEKQNGLLETVGGIDPIGRAMCLFAAVLLMKILLKEGAL